ncbi:nSTAND1 domain-containing NTPase [Sorangium sp. So ce1335]|uniref:nSTAND1 domain-containing NTPase n=1 Tax=Sorangium sp. So ce1335 TaxID=3133335 RepID=UPI003F645B16
MNHEILAPGMVFQSRYEVVSMLHGGDLVSAYRGRQLATGHPIILKVVRLDRGGAPAAMARAHAARFLRQMRSCARLQHPRIVRPIEAGQTDEGQLYAVFQLVSGQSLSELLAEQGALEPQEARHLMLQVLDALACAHRRGMVHGALQPSRVMAVPAGALRDAMVLDLGFAAIAAGARAGRGETLAASSELAAWQAYASPEQLRGYPPTARSDLYAWGLVFLECLTGRRADMSSSPEREALLSDSGGRARMPPALLDHPLGAILRSATIEEVAARAATADALLCELDACEVSGLRRDALIAPCAPRRAGEGREGSAEERRISEESEGRDAAAPQRSRGPRSPTASVEEPERLLTLTTASAGEAPVSPVPGDRAHGAEPSPAGAAKASQEPTSGRMPMGLGDTIKHYEIIRKLGQGGMGVVFLARDMRLGRLIAVKLLLRYSGHGIERFLAEARVTARCRHENIVVIHEVDEIRGYPYIVLEYIKGPTLRQWMAQRDQASAPGSRAIDTPPRSRAPGAVIELMVPVVRALVCAHEHGIVHRDLKPENILLDESGCIKVVDFGIAKDLEVNVVSTLTGARAALAGGARRRRKSAAVGTPRYMAPEQLLGMDVDHRADLWAVGIVLHELLTGQHPLQPFSLARLSSIADLDEPMPGLRERHPELGALGALVDRCLRKRKAERIGSARELLGELDELRPARKALDLGEEESPFAGLTAFQEADAARFFGRDREIAAVAARLRNQPLVAIAAPSGAGKSSFVRAGVIPALKRSGDRWEAFVLRPGRRPLAALVDVLAQIAEADAMRGATAGSRATAGSAELPDPDGLIASLRTQPGSLGASLRARCRREGQSRRILLFVDQLEELYTLGAAPEELAIFVACLQGAADDASSPVRAMLAIRSDFLDRVGDDRGFMADVTRGLWFLPPMGREGLREALARPSEAAGYRFEAAEMVEHILDSLESARSPLPLLQFTAMKLWEARDRERRLLTRESHERLGGVAGALSAHADAVLSALSSREQRLARAVLLRLVTPERTRAVVSLDELRECAQDGEGGAGDTVAQVVQHLADARLLLIETGGEREGATVELVHESLIERWAKLKQWLTESEQDAEFLARLRAAARQWEASGSAEGLLWRDRAAEDARAWHERRRAERSGMGDDGIGRREERYLSAVVAFHERAQRVRRGITAGVIAVLGAVALMVSLLAIDNDRQATRARQQATRAAEQAALADQETARAHAQARAARNATRMATARARQADPTIALAILREMEPEVPRGWHELTSRALHFEAARAVLDHPAGVTEARYSRDGKRIVTASTDAIARVWNADGTSDPVLLRGHRDAISSAAFSPDGKRIVTASRDTTARLWNADGSGEAIVLRGHEAEVRTAEFNPEGTRIVTASSDETVRLWNADGSGEPMVLRGHRGAVLEASFSPDGKRIVTVSEDETTRVWRADGSGESMVLRGHRGAVHKAAFSPDGKRIVTASKDRTARVWNADAGGELVVLRGHRDAVIEAAFSPDGKRIVTASYDGTARIWSADGSGKPVVLQGYEAPAYFAEFSPDGKRIATLSYDRAVRLWNVQDPGEPMVLQQEAIVSRANFSPDSKRIVATCNDRTVRIWNADDWNGSRILHGHESVVIRTALSPDGGHVATASYKSKIAWIWDTDDTVEPVAVRGHEDNVTSVAFSPGGNRIVTASKDGTARIWNADGTGKTIVVRGHKDVIYSAAFSPGGERIVTASEDRTARIWNADGTGEPLVFRGHESGVASAAFSPDGERIVTASGETVRVWNADGTGEPLVLRGHEDEVMSAVFSPDGKRILTASFDRTARVWNADGSGEPLVFRGHQGEVLMAAFSPDGGRIVTASQDGAVRLWDADRTSEPQVALGFDFPAISAAFSPDGERIVTAYRRSVRLWTDLDPLRGVDDPRLWTATTYCMAVERRKELFGVPDATARADREACLRRVEAARAAAPTPGLDAAARPSGDARR